MNFYLDVLCDFYFKFNNLNLGLLGNLLEREVKLYKIFTCTNGLHSPFFIIAI